MRMTMFLIAAATMAVGCSKGGGSSSPAPRNSDVVVVNDKASGSTTTGARTIHVPRGHYPPPGMCRVWIPGTPPGHQPKPAPCSTLAGKVPNGAFVLYNNRAYDANHAWAREKKSRPSNVPDVIVTATKRESSASSKSSKSSPSKASSSSKAKDSKSTKSKKTESSDSTSKANGKKPK
jgi:hypothetical protein